MKEENQQGWNKIIEKIKGKKVYKTIGICLTLLSLSLILLAITLALSSGVFNINIYRSYFRSPLLILMNFIPIIILMSLIYLISNRLWLGYTITSIVFLVLGIANKQKIIYRDSPVTFLDIKLIKEALKMTQEYEIRISSLLIMVIVGLVLITIGLRLFLDLKINSNKTRMGAFLVLMVVSLTFFGGIYFDSAIYAELGDEKVINKWIESQRHQSKGLVYPFLYSIKDAIVRPPEDYDEKRALEILDTYTYKDIAEDKKVHLVTIMLEAYNDFSKFDGLEINGDVYQYFHKLQDQSISASLVTNVFAGGTIDTERAFLTGYYNQPQYKAKRESHVWYLRDQGYMTEAMHPITGSFYDRRNGNEFIGFENFDYYENKYAAIQEEYMMDMRFFDFIIEGFEKSVKEGRPYFNYALTYQNHGPYSDQKVREEEYLKRKEKYNQGDYNIINNYLAGIYSTNLALEKLVDYFENSDEPVVLVLFGDHNPWLGQDNSSYSMLDINMDLASLEGFENYYKTPYIIWANKEAKQITGNSFIGGGRDISPNHLMTEVFENIGWEGSDYMQYLRELSKELPINHKLYLEENGIMQPSSQISEKTKDLWKDFIDVEYYMQSNFQKR